MANDKMVTVILNARFYDYKESDVKAAAESCKCGSYLCEKCSMRSNAVRLGWISRAAAEDFEFDGIPIDWDKKPGKVCSKCGEPSASPICECCQEDVEEGREP
jgi:hypothetical protein